jgi:hypothetical protein
MRNNPMIELIRQEASIRMSVDADGAALLSSAFREALAGGSVRVEVLLGRSVLTMKRDSRIQGKAVEVVLGDVAEPTLSLVRNDVVWVLGREDLEAGIESLENALQKHAFVPAEFLLVRVPKNKKLDYIYAEFRLAEVNLNRASHDQAPRPRSPSCRSTSRTGAAPTSSGSASPTCSGRSTGRPSTGMANLAATPVGISGQSEDRGDRVLPERKPRANSPNSRTQRADRE